MHNQLKFALKSPRNRCGAASHSLRHGFAIAIKSPPYQFRSFRNRYKKKALRYRFAFASQSTGNHCTIAAQPLRYHFAIALQSLHIPCEIAALLHIIRFLILAQSLHYYCASLRNRFAIASQLLRSSC
jgi:hypothetical protein